MRKSALKSNKAFTLVEIMIVVGIIIVLASLGIPSLLRARITANEAAAIKGLRTLSAAFASYRVVNPRYPVVFAELCGKTTPYLDNSWGNTDSTYSSNPRQGYVYIMKFAEDEAMGRFLILATPQRAGVTGNRAFEITEDGEVIDSSSGLGIGAVAPE
ncbi:MAG: prepilin-type N-terminal cleavage/methylation domain-containing protein [Candidatus Omnitrophica bacterium]|nr:prepilin-type N-terminal cleavage/methylation domain-containing protein [Candidatus Omnitrophota bacterium]